MKHNNFSISEINFLDSLTMNDNNDDDSMVFALQTLFDDARIRSKTNALTSLLSFVLQQPQSKLLLDYMFEHHRNWMRDVNVSKETLLQSTNSIDMIRDLVRLLDTDINRNEKLWIDVLCGAMQDKRVDIVSVFTNDQVCKFDLNLVHRPCANMAASVDSSDEILSMVQLFVNSIRFDTFANDFLLLRNVARCHSMQLLELLLDDDRCDLHFIVQQRKSVAVCILEQCFRVSGSLYVVERLRVAARVLDRIDGDVKIELTVDDDLIIAFLSKYTNVIVNKTNY